jgi:hypothetical protein
MVIETLNIVKLKHGAIARGQVGNGTFNGETIHRTGLS